MRWPHFQIVFLLASVGVCFCLNAQESHRSALSSAGATPERRPAPATYPVTTQRDPTLFLRGLFRFQKGDDRRWAAADFDDSQWPLVPSDQPSPELGNRLNAGMAWYRFSVVLPAGSETFALRLPEIRTCYQVFVDGKLMFTQGQLPPHPVFFTSVPVLIPLSGAVRPEPQAMHFAIRVWGGQLDEARAAGIQDAIQVGPLAQLQEPFSNARRSVEADSAADFCLALLELVAASVALALFLFRRSEQEYLWFVLMALGLVDLHLVLGAGTGRSYPILLIDTVALIGLRLFQVALMLFLRRLLSAKWTFFLRLALLCAFLAMIDDLLWGLPHVVSSKAGNLVDNFLQLPIFLWSIQIACRRAWQRWPDARLLAVPLALLIFTQQFSDIATTFAVFGHTGLAKWVDQYLTMMHPLRADYIVFSEGFFLLAMLAILVNRFSRATRNQDRVQSELEAARAVQRLLLPTEPPETKGFKVESVYLPAQEVGGDFFHVTLGDDASLLIIVGDVSGKGLSAAMSVSTIVGAIRVHSTREPAEILRSLNQALFGHMSGFATCCAALIDCKGLMTVANAGHLSPYRNGAEMPLEGGLPLGLMEYVEYTSTSFNLQVGDHLTFISDGVVEASNRKGELFGFERTASVSSKSANEIAEAAKTFGQNDDITVLSVVLSV